jgi:precorrin-6B methylase 2
MDELFYEIFAGLPRQGPGDRHSTLRALKSIPGLPYFACILDIGCGTGNQTIDLAGAINGQIIAADNHQPFLDTLKGNAARFGYLTR